MAEFSRSSQLPGSMMMPSSGLLEKWVGKALVRPSNGSDQQRDGYAGAYALVACSADSCLGAIRLLADELLENDVYLSGFEWFLRIPDFDRKLSEEDIIYLVVRGQLILGGKRTYTFEKSKSILTQFLDANFDNLAFLNFVCLNHLLRQSNN